MFVHVQRVTRLCQDLLRLAVICACAEGVAQLYQHLLQLAVSYLCMCKG